MSASTVDLKIMEHVETEKDEYYTVWRLIAEHGLLPQNLHAFGLISKMHRSESRTLRMPIVHWRPLEEDALVNAI